MSLRRSESQNRSIVQQRVHDFVPSLARQDVATFGDHRTTRGSFTPVYLMWVGRQGKSKGDSIRRRRNANVTPSMDEHPAKLIVSEISRRWCIRLSDCWPFDPEAGLDMGWAKLFGDLRSGSEPLTFMVRSSQLRSTSKVQCN